MIARPKISRNEREPAERGRRERRALSPPRSARRSTRTATSSPSPVRVASLFWELVNVFSRPPLPDDEDDAARDDARARLPRAPGGVHGVHVGLPRPRAGVQGPLLAAPPRPELRLRPRLSPRRVPRRGRPGGEPRSRQASTRRTRSTTRTTGGTSRPSTRRSARCGTAATTTSSAARTGASGCGRARARSCPRTTRATGTTWSSTRAAAAGPPTCPGAGGKSGSWGWGTSFPPGQPFPPQRLSFAAKREKFEALNPRTLGDPITYTNSGTWLTQREREFTGPKFVS